MNFRYPIYLLILILFPLKTIGKTNYTLPIASVKIQGQTQDTPIPTLQTIPGQKIKKSLLNKDISALYQTGYFETVSVETIASNNANLVTFIVSENPQISTIIFEGNHHLKTKHLKKIIQTKPQTILNYKSLNEDKETIESYYKKNGYIFAKVAHIELTKTHQLLIIIDEGEVENLKITGLKNIRNPQIILRQLNTQKGQPFNSKTLLVDRNKLLQMGYFSEVSSPKIAENKETGKVQITFKVTEKKTNRVDIGIEQEERQMVGFIRGVKNHTLIESDLLSGKFQAGNASAVDTNKYSYSLRYSQPWLMNKIPLSFTTDFWNELRHEIAANQATQETKTVEATNRNGSAITFGLPIMKDRLHFYTKYKRETITPQESNSSITAYKIRSLSGLFNYDSTTETQNPEKGSYWNFEYEKGGNLKFAQLEGLNFTRLLFKAATFKKVASHTVLALHTSTGFFNTDSGDSSTFETENFIIGGANSIRGYKETDYPFTGTRKIVINSEYRWSLFRKWQLVLFYDLGKAFNDKPTLKNLNEGRGVGVRYFAPIGALRLDIAQGKGQDEVIFHFGLGQIF